MNRPEGFPLTVDTLVNTNGNYIIAYTYSNWGDNVLFILPNLQMTIEEQDINTAVMDAAYDEINNTKIPYPKKLTDTIIHKTCAMLRMDIDGDATDYPKWIAYRDNMIRHNPRVFVQVKWYKTLFKIKCLINKILGGKS